MKLASFIMNGEKRVGVVEPPNVIPLPKDMGDMVAIIQAGPSLVEEIKKVGDTAAQKLALDTVRLLAPIGRFRRDVLCTGWNYWAHFEEGRGRREKAGEKVEAPDHPTFFTKAPDVVIGPNDAIAYDNIISQKWDYEAELVVVFGRDGRSIPEDRALEHVFGYCLANDISNRDMQRAHGGQWFKGKSTDATMPLGPWITTNDEIDASRIDLQCEVNGQIRQQASTRLMAFSIPRLIAELSWGMTIRAGDILLTGTPAGVGNAMVPPGLLSDGDKVIVRGQGLGELRNQMKSTDLHSLKEA